MRYTALQALTRAEHCVSETQNAAMHVEIGFAHVQPRLHNEVRSFG